MSRPTFTARENLVRIHVCGVPRRFPKIPDDKGLVNELLDTMLNKVLPSPYFIERTGGGEFIALFDKEHAEQIYQWLRQRADEVHEHPDDPV